MVKPLGKVVTTSATQLTDRGEHVQSDPNFDKENDIRKRNLEKNPSDALRIQSNSSSETGERKSLRLLILPPE